MIKRIIHYITTPIASPALVLFFVAGFGVAYEGLISSWTFVFAMMVGGVVNQMLNEWSNWK